MKKILFCIFAIFASIASAQSSFVARSSTNSWNVALSTKQLHRVEWRQGETVELDYLLDNAGIPLDLSATNLLAVWEVVASTNLQEVWVATTGTVMNATNGHVRFRLAPEESNLETNEYLGFVRALQTVGTNLVNMGVLVPQAVTVKFSPDSRYYTVRGPLNYAWRVEEDPYWAAASALVLYAESDPIWTNDKPNYATMAEGSLATNKTSVEIGSKANGANHGVAIGPNCDAVWNGVALGESAKARSYGIALGMNARGSNYGIAAGYSANGIGRGIALGWQANGSQTNIAIGGHADAQGGSERIAIGRAVLNEVDNSAAIRGTLYLDGGTTVMARATFGAGDWINILAQVGEGGAAYSWGNHATNGYVTGSVVRTETDPIWTNAAPAITTNAAKGAAAYAWGNHASAGYATGTVIRNESDPIWTNAAPAITTNAGKGAAAYAWGNHATNGYVTGTVIRNESDPIWTNAAPAIATNAGKGAAAYAWGNHASAGYATGSVIRNESDPIWTNAAPTITTNAGKGAAAYAWGNHASAGYATGAVIRNESDPIWTNAAPTITTNAGKGAAAYAWGNHASAGYATGAVIRNESDPIWTNAAPAITTNAGKGAAAYTWGNHASAGYATGAVIRNESDPIWTAASGLYVRTAGSTMSGALTNNQGVFVQVENALSSELLYNPLFVITNGWTYSGNASWGSNSNVVFALGGLGTLQYATTATNILYPSTYRLVFTVWSADQTQSVSWAVCGRTGLVRAITSYTTFTQIVHAVSNELIFSATPSAACYLDNVSLMRLTNGDFWAAQTIHANTADFNKINAAPVNAVEADPRWQAGTGALWTAVDARVRKTGDTMTGGLTATVISASSGIILGGKYTNAWPIGGGGSGNVSMSNKWSLIYSDGSTNVVELPLGGSRKALISGGTNAAPDWWYPITVTNFSDGAPHKKYDFVTYAGSTWYAKEDISSNIPYTTEPHSISNYPLPGVPPGLEYVWGRIAAKGDAGENGVSPPAPENGDDGVGNVWYGTYQHGKTYDTNHLVSYDGQIYESIILHSNAYPNLNTNCWRVAVARGVSGSIYGPTNIVFTGNYSDTPVYLTNMAATWLGSLWYITNEPVAGTKPPTEWDSSSAYWALLVARGADGPAGPSGAITYTNPAPIESNTWQYHYIVLNGGEYVQVTNNPAEGNDFLQWIGTNYSGGVTTNIFRWAPAVDPRWTSASNAVAYTDRANSFAATQHFAFVLASNLQVGLGSSSAGTTGMIRFNASSNAFEGYTSNGWGVIAGGVVAESDPIWSATSAVVSAAASEGAEAHGWGNHASAGYAYSAGGDGTGTLVRFHGTNMGGNLAFAGAGLSYTNADGTNTLLLNGYAIKAGDTMTGSFTVTIASATAPILTLNRASAGQYSVMRIDSTNYGIAIGLNATAAGAGGPPPDNSCGVAVGANANAADHGTAIGGDANGSSWGVAVGVNAAGNGGSAVAVGRNANAAGAASVAVGCGANSAAGHSVSVGHDATCGSGEYGVSVGFGSQGNDRAIGIGCLAQASKLAIVIGTSPGTYNVGDNTNIAIGVNTTATGGQNRISFGLGVNNEISDSARIRGSLYLDGGAGLYFRTNFGVGDWATSIIVSNTGSTGELWACDSAGNKTQISSHEGIRHIIQSENRYAGVGRIIDVDQLAETIQELTGRTNIVTWYSFPAVDFAAEQWAAWSNRQAEIAAYPAQQVAYSNAYAEWAANTNANRPPFPPPSPGPCPAEYVRQGVPNLSLRHYTNAPGVPTMLDAIETPTLVLTAQTNGTPGIALEADESGDLYTYIYHASPVDSATIASNRAAALTRIASNRAARIVSKGNMGKGQLQARLEAIEAWISAQDRQ